MPGHMGDTRSARSRGNKEYICKNTSAERNRHFKADRFRIDMQITTLVGSGEKDLA